MKNNEAKDFLIKRGVDCIHIGNIDKFSKLLNEYHNMKMKEYLVKQSKENPSTTQREQQQCN